MHFGEKVGRPRDRVGLARACSVLDEILAAGTIMEYGRLEFPRDVKLMVPGKNDLGDLLLRVSLGDEVAAENLQPAIACPDLFPQIGRTVAVRVQRVPSGPVIALIERKKASRRACEPGHHVDLAVADREMH